MKAKILSNFVRSLNHLKKFNISGFKQSLEDEGATFKEIKFIRKILKNLKIKQNIKIGGCEAINDILFCKTLNVDGIIAPMVESSYALRKFLQVIKFVGFKKNIYFNLETISAIKNINQILNNENAKQLSGVVIGRSDICGSLNLKKEDVNNNKIFNLVNSSINKINSKNKYQIKMGGSITPLSIIFIKKLFYQNKIHFIETRNIEIKLDKKNINLLEFIIKQIFLVEMQWLQIKSSINKDNKFLRKQYAQRIVEIKKRLKK